MYNCLLEQFPTEYRGSAINTSFRVGIALTLLTEDTRFPEDLKLLKAFDLLYKDKVPDFETAFNGMMWFLSCGRSEIYYLEDELQDTNEKYIDFQFDSFDIYGAFLVSGVDLHKSNMHWFKFMAFLNNLGDCPLSQKISYRATDTSKMKGDTKNYYIDLKSKFKIKTQVTKEERDAYLEEQKEKFGSYYYKLLGGK